MDLRETGKETLELLAMGPKKKKKKKSRLNQGAFSLKRLCGGKHCVWQARQKGLPRIGAGGTADRAILDCVEQNNRAGHRK